MGSRMKSSRVLFMSHHLFFDFLKRFYLLFIRERERERERGRVTGIGRSRLHAGSPDVGFDPRSPGSRPGLKAGAKPLRHPGIPETYFF